MPYQQNPVSVIKGNHVVKDVYLSDLAAWQSEGYEIYDGSPIPSEPIPEEEPVITPKKKTKSTPESTPVETE